MADRHNLDEPQRSLTIVGFMPLDEILDRGGRVAKLQIAATPQLMWAMSAETSSDRTPNLSLYQLYPAGRLLVASMAAKGWIKLQPDRRTYSRIALGEAAMKIILK